MNAAELIAKLSEIERNAGKGDPVVVRAMVIEAQEGVLHAERELIATFRENERLRERMEERERSSLPGLTQTRIAEDDGTLAQQLRVHSAVEPSR
jgi:hypothetical protein